MDRPTGTVCQAESQPLPPLKRAKCTRGPRGTPAIPHPFFQMPSFKEKGTHPLSRTDANLKPRSQKGQVLAVHFLGSQAIQAVFRGMRRPCGPWGCCQSVPSCQCKRSTPIKPMPRHAPHLSGLAHIQAHVSMSKPSIHLLHATGGKLNLPTAVCFFGRQATSARKSRLGPGWY